MPIPVTCPNGHKMRVKEEHAGKRVACPKCKAPFRIPALDEIESDLPPPGLLEDRPAKPSPGAKPCPSCGASLPPDSVLCVDCGFDLRTGESLQSAGASPKPAVPRKKAGRRPKAKRSKSSVNLAFPKVLLPAAGAGAAVAIALLVFFFVLGPASPEATARAYMAAAEDGDIEAVKPLLTAKAREFFETQLAQSGMPAGGVAGLRGLPGADQLEINYRVGRAETTGETAKVPVTTEVSGPMGQQQASATLLLRRENDRWLVYGVTATFGPGGQELTMDFENPQAIVDTIKQGLEAVAEEAKKKSQSGANPTVNSPGAASPP